MNIQIENNDHKTALWNSTILLSGDKEIHNMITIEKWLNYEIDDDELYERIMEYSDG